MPDDQNKPPISAVAPQPLETAVPSQPMDSLPSDTAPVAPEAPREAPTPVSLNDSSQSLLWVRICGDTTSILKL